MRTNPHASIRHLWHMVSWRLCAYCEETNHAFGRPGSDLLSRVLRRSTIGAGAFHGRVRNGNGCSHPAIATRSAKRMISNREAGFTYYHILLGCGSSNPIPPAPPLSRGSLAYEKWAQAMRMIKPIELLVPVSFTHCCASTPGLSTWSSSTALKGTLVSRWVSRLDAFSGYPFRT